MYLPLKHLLWYSLKFGESVLLSSAKVYTQEDVCILASKSL